MIKIMYGSAPHLIDITHSVIRQHMRGTVIFIPKDDENRAYLFGDPIPRVVKMIIFKFNKNMYIYINANSS